MEKSYGKDMACLCGAENEVLEDRTIRLLEGNK